MFKHNMLPPGIAAWFAPEMVQGADPWFFPKPESVTSLAAGSSKDVREANGVRCVSCQSPCHFVFPVVRPHVRLSVRLSVCLSVILSFAVSVRLFACLPAHVHLDPCCQGGAFSAAGASDHDGRGGRTDAAGPGSAARRRPKINGALALVRPAQED